VVRRKASSRIFLVTFGGGSRSYIQAATRLLKTAKSIPEFCGGVALSPTDIWPDSTEVERQLMMRHKRLFGLGCWKPQVISSGLAAAPEGSLVLYLDAGCEVWDDRFPPGSASQSASWSNLTSQLDPSDIVCDTVGGFGVKRYGAAERTWTKPCVMDYINPDGDPNLPQAQSGVIGFRNTDRSAEFVRTWRELVQVDQGALLTDLTEPESRPDGFVEHRHDQSVFSCLLRASGLAPSVLTTTRLSASAVPVWTARNNCRISHFSPVGRVPHAIPAAVRLAERFPYHAHGSRWRRRDG